MTTSRLLAFLAAAALCGCAAVPFETPPQVPPVPVGFQQLDKGLSQTFVTCQPCAQPTRKTLWAAPAPATEPQRTVNPATVPAQESRPNALLGDKETILSTTVHFAPGMAALNVPAKHSLDAFCHGGMQLDGVTVTGHTDSTGAPELNHKLAEQRTKTTAQFLRACAEAQGTPAHIDERVKGACCYVAPNETPEGRAMNRRVEVEQATQGRPASQADR